MTIELNNKPTLGMGCWPIGGEMYANDGASLGYSNSNDAESIRAIHAALANGISLFDTAAAYGAGHSERLIASALKHASDARIVTKIGIGIDEETKQLEFGSMTPDQVMPSIDACLNRLQRETIDLLLLHDNAMPVVQAELVFDQMETARQAGKITAYGWSTDYRERALAMADRPGFTAVEHAMNVLLDAPQLQEIVHQHGLLALIRSPLAMGLLSGKYTSGSTIAANDVRSSDQGWLQYYVHGQPNPVFLERYHAISELLQIDGRTPVQGALAWLWSRDINNIPIPGARTVQQVEGLAAAIEQGPLPPEVVAEIDTLIVRNHEVDSEDRPR